MKICRSYFLWVLVGLTIPYLSVGLLAQEHLRVGDFAAFQSGSGRTVEVGIVKSIGSKGVEVSPIVGFVGVNSPRIQGSKTIALSQAYFLTETNPHLLGKYVRVGNIEGRVLGTFAERFLWLRGIDETSAVFDHTLSIVAVELSDYEGIQEGTKVRFADFKGRVQQGVVKRVYSDGMLKIVPLHSTATREPYFVMWDQLISSDPCAL